MISKTTLAVGLSLTLLRASLFGGEIGHLVSLTEFSSTNLVATYDGSTMGVMVTQGMTPDSWTVDLPSSAFILGFSGATWVEPNNPPLTGNTVLAIGNSTLSVMSDVAVTLALPNKTIVFTGAFDTRDHAPISITFDDVSDAVAVPEAGSTSALLALGLAVLLVARRFRFQRLA